MYEILHIPTGLLYTCRFSETSVFTFIPNPDLYELDYAEEIIRNSIKDGRICITFDTHAMRYNFEWIDISPNEFDILKVKGPL